MRSVVNIDLDPQTIRKNLNELEDFLNNQSRLKEREHILPFFQSRPHLCAAIGIVNNNISRPDKYATELSLFGDFSCDAVSGDVTENSFTLIEFEDASMYSIFKARPNGGGTRAWSSRFEHGYSQIVDWAWRLSNEGFTSQSFENIFGVRNPTIMFALVIGRDSDLTDLDLRRLEWRSKHTSLGGFHFSCYTFDGLLRTLNRRLELSIQTPNI